MDTIDISSILRELQSRDEFKIDTSTNRKIIQDISTLLTLQEPQLSSFVAIVTDIIAQVNLLLLPVNLPKFTSNIYKFRACDLPVVLSDTMAAHKLPSELCDDLILWQLLVDKVIERLTTLTRQCRSQKRSRILSPVEQNAVRYTGGAVIRKLLKKNKSNIDETQFLNTLLKEKDDMEDISDSTEVWLRNTDRGGLLYITDTALELFIELEMFFSYHLSVKDTKDMKTLSEMATLDSDILMQWGDCTLDYEKDLTHILTTIVQEWIKCRGHAMARKEMEKYKRKKAEITKKKSLRKELRRQLDNSDTNNP